MPKKKTDTEKVIEKIFDYTLEDIMGERFGSYSKYIIQDRAIPDARDGLKPVQRRILYSMHKEHNTYDKGYRKSAKTVGDVIGNYHPHGDTSIYDAMVRMSQPWKTRLPYIDMHGNNGSIDGDSPAAYRYTEARLSKIANEMLRDIEKDTVEFAPNFDDTTTEPTVLPARFPALLVYGAQGISAGYATNIPTHNLNEVVDATIHRIDYPNCSLETLMKHVKRPDFPTGGVVEGIEGIKEAYETGRGRIIVKSRFTIEKDKIIITEIPFEVNKALMVKKIDDIRIDKKVDGIVEVRDESASDIRIVIELKKTANVDLIVNYLLKNTDMQISYNFNMVSIVNRRPKLLGLIGALDAFIAHQKEVIRRRTEFDLAHARARYHILEGLIKCISILDEVIKVIRASKNKADAKENLVKEFDFTLEQAEAIVTLQLYRLTNTDVVLLEEEMKDLEKKISIWEQILNNEAALKHVMKKELQNINKEYVTPRLTDIKDEITEIKIDQEALIVKEDVVVVVTKEGYVKRTPKRSYNSSNDEDITLKDNDFIIGLYEMNTIDTLLLFTNQGNYLYVPVHELPDMKWKEMGKHISNIITIKDDEKIIYSMPVYDFNHKEVITIFSKNGMVKRCNLIDFKVQRYNKPITCMKLKYDDEIISVTNSPYTEVFISTNNGYGLWYSSIEIPIVGVRAAGVKAIKLDNDYVVSAQIFDKTSEYITIFTDKQTAKRVKLSEFEKSSRARKGLLLVRLVKTNPYKILSTYVTNSKEKIGIVNLKGINIIKNSEINISDRYSTGSSVSSSRIISTFIVSELENKEEKIEVIELPKEEKQEVSLKEIDEEILTIDDFLDDFKIE